MDSNHVLSSWRADTTLSGPTRWSPVAWDTLQTLTRPHELRRKWRSLLLKQDKQAVTSATRRNDTWSPNDSENSLYCVSVEAAHLLPVASLVSHQARVLLGSLSPGLPSHPWCISKCCHFFFFFNKKLWDSHLCIIYFSSHKREVSNFIFSLTFLTG